MADEFNKNLPDLVNPADVADALDVTTGHVRHLARTGQLPAVYIGPKCIRFEVEAVRHFVDSRRGVRPGEDDE